MVLAGRAIYGDEIQRLRQRIEAEDYVRGAGRSARDGHRARVPRAHRRRLQARAADEDRRRFGQRHPGRLGAGILRALGCEVIELYSEVDGDFPNHHPDPSKPENLADLIKAPSMPPTPNSAWPSTATATGWASSPRTAKSSTPTAS
jgi:phosphomannomutase